MKENSLWYNIQKRKGYTQINARVTQYLHDWILQLPQVFQSPISKNCIKLSIDSTTEKQVVPKLLLEVYVR